MYKSHFYILCLAFMCLKSVSGRRYSLRRKDCRIPIGTLYDRATFRLQYGNEVDPLARGQRVGQYHRVVIVCHKDILTDLIISYHVVTCHRGRWKPRMPDCTGPKNCNYLEPVKNAASEVLLGNDVDYPHGTVVKYTCNDGYEMEGQSERHCVNGVWDDVKFTCKLVWLANPGVFHRVGPRNCSHLEPVENAALEVLVGNDVDFPHGTILRYTCNEGYEMEGHNERHCRNGVWDDAMFNCIREQRPENCHQIEPVENAASEVLVGNDANYPHGTVLRYTCNKGYEMEGHNKRRCINGVWDDVQFTCIFQQQKCDSLHDKFDLVNDIGSATELQNGSVVRIQCRWSWFPKDGIIKATCINGEWKPRKPYCEVVCKIPRRKGRYFTLLSTGMPVRNRVANRATVVQHCDRGPANSRSSRSTCTNGRWRPPFKYCPSQGRASFRSYTNICTVPDNTSATYISVFGDILRPLDKVPDDFQVTQVCDGDYEETVYNESNSSICYGGRWIPEFHICSNNDPTNETLCTKPDIKFATFLPLLETYYVDETLGIHCHKNREIRRENITCLESGKWSKNVSCEAVKETAHCLQPKKAQLVYWPVKDIYEVNDTITILSCGEGFVRAGSEKMRCTPGGTWEGDFECLSPCEHGKIDVKPTNLNYCDLTYVKKKQIGWLDDITKCAENCVFSVNFSCASIKVYKLEEQLYCELLSKSADPKYCISSDGAGSKIYNVNCDTTCHLQAEEEVSFTNVDGGKLVDTATFRDGTVLNINCTDKQTIKEKQTVTCIAGNWNMLSPFCA